MASSVFPTSEDVGGSGAGRICTEESLSAVFGGPWRRNFVVSGLTAANGGGFTVNVAAGVAMVEGYLVELDAEAVTVNYNEANQHWYVSLTRDVNDRVTGYEWQRVVDPALDGSEDPADSAKVFAVDTDSTGIDAGPADRRSLKKDVIYGEYDGTGGSQTITLNLRPALVVVCGDGGAQADIYAVSHVFYTLNFGFYVDGAGTAALSSSASFVPLITSAGFQVDDDAALDNLSQSGRTYRYICLPS